MHELLHMLRRAFEYEVAFHGPLLPLGKPSPDRTSSSRSAPRDSQFQTALSASSPPSDTPTPAARAEAADAMANLDLFGNTVDPSKDPSRPPAERISALIPAGSPLHTMTTLEEVADYANNTVLIPLDASRLNAVMGTGDPEADLVIIGEAPGAEEDRTGEPFTGRAGLLLNKILEAINFKREDVYITNILKSRPPNNRDPLPAEIEGHLPLLYKQLALIQPKIILCVGKTAGNTLLSRRSTLGALRDKIHDFYGLPVIVTYHPAALLRNPQWKRPTWEDVKLLRTKYDQFIHA